MTDDTQPDEEAWERLFTQLDAIAALERCYEELTSELIAVGGPDATLLSDAMSRHGAATVADLALLVREGHPEFEALQAASRRLVAAAKAARPNPA